MAQTAQVILEEMKKGIFHPLYFLQGEEPFFIDQIRQYAEDHVLEPGERGFNQIFCMERKPPWVILWFRPGASR